MSGRRAILWLIFFVPDQIDGNLSRGCGRQRLDTSNREPGWLMVYYKFNLATGQAPAWDRLVVSYLRTACPAQSGKPLCWDVSASNNTATKIDPGFVTAPQRFYRMMLVNASRGTAGILILWCSLSAL